MLHTLHPPPLVGLDAFDGSPRPQPSSVLLLLQQPKRPVMLLEEMPRLKKPEPLPRLKKQQLDEMAAKPKPQYCHHDHHCHHHQ